MPRRLSAAPHSTIRGYGCAWPEPLWPGRAEEHLFGGGDHAGAKLGPADGQRVVVGNERGDVTLPIKTSDTVRPGVLVHEGLWPNSAFERGEGTNVLTGADSPPPFGGSAFHDTRVWVRVA
ncbi:hypothetical protein LA66_07785 [Aureimonas altamirensis]|uniref:Molybdopterin dinucleotide-binding domain-containing protein n=1 Tax=Aureimonas altamirensis TaxID=370622 RepID=A0A0B1QBX1_9HYPH|nr:hypothetical protein LA66_07785 [Aureimonas altamirensis]